MPKKNNKNASSQLIGMTPNMLKTMVDVFQKDNEKMEKSIESGNKKINFLKDQALELENILSNSLKKVEELGRDNDALQKEIDELESSLKEKDSKSQTSVSTEEQSLISTQTFMKSDNKKKFILDDRGKHINSHLGGDGKNVYLLVEKELHDLMGKDPSYEGPITDGVDVSRKLFASLGVYHNERNTKAPQYYWAMDNKNTTFAEIYNRFNKDRNHEIVYDEGKYYPSDAKIKRMTPASP